MAKRRRTTHREWIIIFLVTGLIMGLYYSNAFTVHNEALKNCERINKGFGEVNARTPKFNALFEVERNEDDHVKDRKYLTPVQNVTLADCEASFHEPWPFG